MSMRARLLSGVVMFVLTCAVHAGAEPPFAWIRTGDSLEASLHELNARGSRIVFSSALVRSHMTVRRAPSATELASVLQELLSPWDLEAIRSDRGEWLVVRARDDSAKSSAAPAIAPPSVDRSIESIDVTATRFDIADTNGGATYFDHEEVERMPHVFDDAVRMLKVLPGVNGGDYSARLHVRGGRRDETKLVIDGAPIHGGFHFREVDGMVSIMDTNLVESLEFTTGGMTAEHSDAMSGSVSIRSLEPSDDDAFNHAVGISFVSAFARSGGLFSQGKGSWLASARRGYLDLLVKRVQPDEERLVPRFQDVFAKARYALSESTDVSAHLLLATNELRFTDEIDDVDSDGRAEDAQVWLTLDHAFSDRLRATTLVAFASTDDVRDVSGSDEDVAADLASHTEATFLDLQQDWALTLGRRSLLRWGLSGSFQEADYDYQRTSFILDPFLTSVPIDTSFSADASVSSRKWGAYATWRSSLTERLTTELGARWDEYRYPDGLRFARWSPRFNAVWRFDTGTELRAAWGSVHQPQSAHELQIEDGVTRFFEPEEAEHSLLGVVQELSPAVSLRVDLYRKEYDHLRPRFENAVDPIELVPEAGTDRILIDAPRARSTGVEISMRRAIQDAWGGWISYARARAEDLELGTWRLRSWDHRDTLSFGLTWAGSKWSVNVAGIYQSGSPTTPVGLEPVEGGAELDWRIVPGERNSDRFDYFARLDARLSRKVAFESSSLTYYFEIINLLNRDNPCCVEDYVLVGRQTARPQLIAEQGSWLPLLPSFGFRYDF